jgi:hypothetical protein
VKSQSEGCIGCYDGDLQRSRFIPVLFRRLNNFFWWKERGARRPSSTGAHFAHLARLAHESRRDYAVKKRRSEESMQLDKVQPPLLGIVLWNR